MGAFDQAAKSPFGTQSGQQFRPFLQYWQEKRPEIENPEIANIDNDGEQILLIGK